MEKREDGHAQHWKEGGTKIIEIFFLIKNNYNFGPFGQIHKIVLFLNKFVQRFISFPLFFKSFDHELSLRHREKSNTSLAPLAFFVAFRSISKSPRSFPLQKKLARTTPPSLSRPKRPARRLVGFFYLMFICYVPLFGDLAL